VSLTEGGDLLADYVHRAFEVLATGLQRLGQPRRRTTLVIMTTRSFALRVLAPRMGAFVTRYPWIDVRFDTHRYYTDLGHSPGDVTIAAGDVRRSDLAVERLTTETVFPVCAPAIWPGRSSMEPKPDFFRNQILLHYAERPLWSKWLQAVKLDPKLANSGPSFSETALALAAAEAGQGIAICRMSLVADALSRGTLVRPFKAEISDGVDYFLLTRKNDVNKPMVKAFSEWLRTEMAELSETCRKLNKRFSVA
jgi:DNA-binding transcriptional LysR family regulator